MTVVQLPGYLQEHWPAIRARLGPWRIANSPAMSIAFPTAYFDSIGLPRMLTVT
jgi:hypothetical protein